jgi:hypothetical protein
MESRKSPKIQGESMDRSRSEFNLKKLVLDVFQPMEGERVTVMLDVPHGSIRTNPRWEERLQVARQWRESLELMASDLGISVNPMLTFEATGAHNCPLPEYGRWNDDKVRIEDVLEETNIALAMTQYSASAPLLEFIERIPTLRIASLPGMEKRMESTALSADYGVISERSHLLERKLTRAERALALFSTGQEIVLDLRHRTARADDGRCRPGGTPQERLINLPSGEAYIVPYEGEIPGDRSLTQGEIPVHLGDEMIVLRVEENQIVECRGSSEPALEMSRFFDADPARRNVAELGLGCNERAVVTGNVLEDEKAGFHWAYGRSDHLGGRTGVNAFLSPENVVHIDIVYAHGNPIEVSRLVLRYPDRTDEEIMRDSSYTVF